MSWQEGGEAGPLYALDRAESLAISQAQLVGELKVEREALRREVRDLRQALAEAESDLKRATYLLNLQTEEEG